MTRNNKQGQTKASEVAMNNPGKRNTYNKNNNNGKKNLNEEKGKKVTTNIKYMNIEPINSYGYLW